MLKQKQKEDIKNTSELDIVKKEESAPQEEEIKKEENGVVKVDDDSGPPLKMYKTEEIKTDVI